MGRLGVRVTRGPGEGLRPEEHTSLCNPTQPLIPTCHRPARIGHCLWISQQCVYLRQVCMENNNQLLLRLLP